MPVRIPDVPQAPPTQPGLPRASLAAAAAPGRAMGALAEGIASVGKPFAEIAERIQSVENATHESEIRQQFAKGYSDLTVRLTKEPDPVKHLELYDQWLSGAKSILDDPNLSPQSRDRMGLWFDEAASSGRIRTAEGAASLGLQRGRLAAENEVTFYRTQGRFDLADEAVDRAVAEGIILPEQGTKLKTHLAQEAEEDETKREISGDPWEWQEEHPLPGEGETQDTFDRRARYARQKQSQYALEANDSIMAQVYGETPPTLAQIDEQTEDLPEDIRATIRHNAQAAGSEKVRTAQSRPEYINSVSGRAARLISDLDPTGDSYQADYIKIDGMLRTLPPTANRSQLERDLKAVQDGRKNFHATLADEARSKLVRAFNKQRWGGFGEKLDVRPYIDAGLLQDETKLLNLG